MKHYPYSLTTSKGRPSLALMPGEVRQLLEQLEPDGRHLMVHHIDALEPVVYLAIDHVVEQNWTRGRKVENLYFEVIDIVLRAQYWSSRRACVKLFSPLVNNIVITQVVMPLARRILSWRAESAAQDARKDELTTAAA